MALIDSLISYWPLDEASGDRADSHGSNTLTDLVSTGSGTGKINNAADFEADSANFLYHADNASLSTGDIDFSGSVWVKFESLPTALVPIVVKHDGSTVAGSEWALYWESGAARISFTVYSGSSTSTTVSANTFGAISTGVWYHVTWWHDSVNNEIGICINAGTPDTASHSAGVNDTAALFMLGAFPGTSYYMDGLIDELGFWKKVFTSGERTSLYNGGSGLAYPLTESGTGAVRLVGNRFRLAGVGGLAG